MMIVGSTSSTNTLAERSVAAETPVVPPSSLDYMQPSCKSLVLEIELKNRKKSKLAVHFEYFPSIHVVGVETPRFPGILTTLFPGDTGACNPSLVNNYTKKGFEYPSTHMARPFSWAQWICGIYNLTPERQHRPEPSIQAVIEQIRKRFEGQIALEFQLKGLIKSTPLIEVHENAKALFDQDITTTLSSWKEIPAPKTDVFSFLNASEQSYRYGCKYYEASFKNDKVKLNSFVEISPEYPVRPPRFLFQARTPTTSGTAEFNTLLKDAEIEVNAYYKELIPNGSEDWLLSHQLRKVQLCMDIISTLGPQTAVFGRIRRGKDRHRAIAIAPESGEVVHR